MKAWLTIAFSLLFLLPAWTQEVNKLLGTSEHLTLGIGINITTVKDQAHSVLTYNGRGMRVFLTYERIRPDWISRMSLSFDNASLKAKVKPRRDINRSADLSDFQFSLGYYARLGNELGVDNQQYVGGSFNIQINSREYPLPTNNKTGVMMQSSFGLGVVDRRTISGADDWAFTTRADLPVLTALYRPTYTGMPPFLHIDKVKAKHFFSNFKIVSLNRFTKLAIGVDADYQRKGWRTDRLTYDWNLFYTPLPATKSILSTSGALGYGFRVLL